MKTGDHIVVETGEMKGLIGSVVVIAHDDLGYPLVIVRLPPCDGLDEEHIGVYKPDEVTQVVEWTGQIETVVTVRYKDGDPTNNNCAHCDEDLTNVQDWGGNPTGTWVRCPKCNTVTQWDDCEV